MEEFTINPDYDGDTKIRSASNEKLDDSRKFNRYAIEEAIEKEINKLGFVEKVFSEFFLSGTSKILFDHGDRENNDAENVEKFKMIIRHVFKRLLAQKIKEDKSVANSLLSYSEDKYEEIVKDFPIEIRDLFRLLYHDLSHYLITIMRGYNKENSLTPKFLQPNSLFNDRTALEDEFFATIFVFQSFREFLRTSDSFDTFKDKYLDKIYYGVSTVNSNEIKKYCNTHRKQELVRGLEIDGMNILSNIADNPPEKLVEMLRYIWENKDDPRVLVNLFFEDENIKKFILKLKAREKGLREREERHEKEKQQREASVESNKISTEQSN